MSADIWSRIELHALAVSGEGMRREHCGARIATAADVLQHLGAHAECAVEVFAALRTAKIARAWADGIRTDLNGEAVVDVAHSARTGRCYIDGPSAPVPYQEYATLHEAMTAADEHLVAAGWSLVGGVHRRTP